ncbi:copper chaperone PCu(A)C [Streptomyces sp. NBC_00378]|uniref:copper chaperone PCu(A)C n=1 Tax=unclassified Streptomyces TaxID=2593676 RepID=UPI0022583009|nr:MULTISPECIES: copper chaperone PCu(A)C [unclassified Streptomyces]MCX5107791.1 copper chaperone PCu(A)C [Streptomyces sp. NBC_00378]
MTDRPQRIAAGDWAPTRRRLHDGLIAAIAPLAAFSVALGGLTAWTASGAAGAPPQLEVGDGRVFLPYNGNVDTAAFFRITNSGGADDRLVSVTCPAAESSMLSRHVRHDSGAGSMSMVGSVGLPAGKTLAMSPSTVDVMVKVKERLQVGDTLPFVLRFRHSDPVEVVAVVVRPGS